MPGQEEVAQGRGWEVSSQTRPLRIGTGLPLLALGAALLVLFLGAGHARAAGSVNHPFIPESSFEGGETPQGELEGVCGLAVDSNGDVYVADYYHHVVDVFSSASGSGRHEYVTQIKVNPVDGPCGLAVDSSGHLYVNAYHEGVVMFTPSQFPPGPSTDYGSGVAIDPAHSARATGVAVDPASGDLYVDERTSVAVYEAPVLATSEPVRTFGLDASASYYGVAVSSFPTTAGDVYVPDAATGAVKVFDPAGDLVDAFAGGGSPQVGFHSLVDTAVAVDPASGHVLVADNTQPGFEHPAEVVDEFNATGAYRGQLPHAIVEAESAGLAVDPASDDVYASSGNSEEASILAFGPGAAARQVEVLKSGSGAGSVISEPAGINCGSACAAEFDAGARVNLKATPDAHSTFAGWTGCSSEAGRECTVGSAGSVEARFEALPQQSLAVASSGPGTVISAPAGIDCGAECTAGFNENDSVALSAVHGERSTFAGWTGCEAEPGTGRCEVTMSAAKSVTAEFSAIPQQALTVFSTGAGTGTVTGSSPGAEFIAIACGQVCTAAYNQGMQIVLTATPGSTSRLASWSGCESQPSPSECEVRMDAARSVTASFAPVAQRRLTVVAQGAGRGTVTSAPAGIECGATCTAEFPENEVLILSAANAPDSNFDGWSGACLGTGTCKITLDSDRTAIAEFSPKLPPGGGAASPSRLVLGFARPKAGGSVAALEVTVPAAGSLAASGRYLKEVKAKAAGAGLTTLNLQLTTAGKQALAATRHHKLEVKVRVTFKPISGNGSSATRTVTFHRPSKRKGGAALTQRGGLFVSFNGGIAPDALPRHRLAPIAVNVEGKVKAVGDGEPAALSQIEIAINRHGVLDTRGLPTCPRARLASTTTAAALAACRPALVGEGSFAARLQFADQPSFPSRGHLLAFNATSHGSPVILVHVYGTQPIPITRLLVFTIHHTAGTYGTVLTSALPQGASNSASVKFIDLTLHREFSFHRRPHSYLSADCPAPAGFPGATFPLARTAMTFANGSTLAATVTRSCQVLEGP
jgi:hypothetical protein